jgi:hypothetical protein
MTIEQLGIESCFHADALLCREKPFGLIIVLDSNGNAAGDLFYDDGESIDTIGSKSYFYATYTWSKAQNELSISVKENNYPQMANLILDSLTIYGLDNIPETLTVAANTFHPHTRPYTQIVEVTDLGLAMDKSHSIKWSLSNTSTIDVIEIPTSDPKYRIDCHPDKGMNWIL